MHHIKLTVNSWMLRKHYPKMALNKEEVDKVQEEMIAGAMEVCSFCFTRTL